MTKATVNTNLQRKGTTTRKQFERRNNGYNNPHPNSIAAQIMRGKDAKLKAKYREWQREIRKDAGSFERWYHSQIEGPFFGG